MLIQFNADLEAAPAALADHIRTATWTSRRSLKVLACGETDHTSNLP